jgi:hypothetical protein
MRGIQPVGFFVTGLRPIGKNDLAVGKGSKGSSTLEGVLVEGMVVGDADEGKEERTRFLRVGFKVTGDRFCSLLQVGFRVNSDSELTGFADGR